jgi:hypothetical protein
MDESPHSRHPVDVLIRRVAGGTHHATAADIDQMIEGIATAPFDSRRVPVPVPLRGRQFLGQSLQPREPSLVVHLAQRVLGEGQWALQTTIDEYLNDLRRAVRAASRLAVYDRRGGLIVASISITAEIVPETRRSGGSRPLLVVIYSVDR